MAASNGSDYQVPQEKARRSHETDDYGNEKSQKGAQAALSIRSLTDSIVLSVLATWVVTL